MSPCAIITGASRGLGLEYARALSKQGYSLGIIARDRSRLERAAKELSGSGKVVYEVGDATDPAAMRRLVDRTESELGPVTAMIANAGVWGPIGKTWTLEPEKWWADFANNVKAPLVASTAILPKMVERNEGRVILISAMAGTFRWPMCSSYSASKAAVNKLAENIAFELARDSKVKIFSYYPGFSSVGITEQADTILKTSADPDVQKTVKPILQGIAAKRTTPIEKSVQGLMQLLSGKFDQKSGSYLSVDDALKTS